MKIAFVFPGQGSQHVGMGKDFYDNFEESRAIYEAASLTLGYDVAKLSFEGPEEELNKTFRTQPCLLAASFAAYTAVTNRGLRPSVVAGHSLGEYTAIVAAGVMDFPDALKLTEIRGRLMQEAIPEGQGLMAAILGLNRRKVDEICSMVTSGYVEAANYNCPGQIVISGYRDAVEEAMRIAKEEGAKRVVPLSVSVPSHCGLMEPVSKQLGEHLDMEKVRFREAEIPVVSNANAMLLTTAESIKASLLRQLSSPVLWEDSVMAIFDSGVDTFIEIGPGKVLSGLMRRILPKEALILNVSDVESLEKTLSEVNSV